MENYFWGKSHCMRYGRFSPFKKMEWSKDENKSNAYGMDGQTAGGVYVWSFSSAKPFKIQSSFVLVL